MAFNTATAGNNAQKKVTSNIASIFGDDGVLKITAWGNNTGTTLYFTFSPKFEQEQDGKKFNYDIQVKFFLSPSIIAEFNRELKNVIDVPEDENTAFDFSNFNSPENKMRIGKTSEGLEYIQALQVDEDGNIQDNIDVIPTGTLFTRIVNDNVRDVAEAMPLQTIYDITSQYVTVIAPFVAVNSANASSPVASGSRSAVTTRPKRNIPVSSSTSSGRKPDVTQNTVDSIDDALDQIED